MTEEEGLIALRFLNLLDPAGDAMNRVEHWRTTPDRDEGERLYPRAKFASFTDIFATLGQWGEMGYGVAIAVNEMTPNTEKRRSPNGWQYTMDTRYIEQVTRIRALFADLDTKGALPEFPIEPTMIVETSPAKFHVYWCIDPDDQLPIEEFSPLQKNIAARYKPQGADPSAADLNRCLRVPGTLHRKSMPRLVEIIGASGTRHGAAALREAFPAVPPVVRALRPAEPWNGVVPERAINTLERVQQKYGEPNRSDGGYDIECPWASEHSSETSKSSTTYWPPNETNGGNGAFYCMHAHCQHRAIWDFNNKPDLYPSWKNYKRLDFGARQTA